MPKRYARWLRFSLRALAAIVLLCCLGLGWLVWKIKPYRERAAAATALEALGAKVQYHELPTDRDWKRRLFGDELFQTVNAIDFHDADISDEKLRLVEQLPELTGINLGF